MQEILSHHKKVKGSVARQISMNEVSQCHPLGPLHLESFDKKECEALALLFFKRAVLDCSSACEMSATTQKV